MPALGLFCVLGSGFLAVLAFLLLDARRIAIHAEKTAREASGRSYDAASVSKQALDHALRCQIEVGALMKSTHQIQFVPAEQSADEKALNDALRRNDVEALQRIGDLGGMGDDNQEPLM